MKHPSNRELYEYWNQRRGDRLAPERGEIEPGAIRSILGDTFVLEMNGVNNATFRLAGTRLCALFARELKGESFTRLWERTGQTAMRELIAVVMDEKVGVVASVSGATSDDLLQPVGLELLLLPLAAEHRGDARVIGALAPMSAPYWLGAKPIGPLTLGMFRHLGPMVDTTAAPRLRPAAGRLRHGLTVHEGGRTT
ncbi:PAS domain-containing protein [Rhodoplanes sp. Z2-YC6860]|uniref:PAS domain-containing protein n=1 Tax=Rhodoplanes sp. Z2-YC6860 TaxID=674703 RepID=UPI00078EDDAD|nr:PAS domain-containing protein [Rhodoplanes sp. Z2-YC6860]AMN42730.1 hypothetical protein RHPLAN_43000 [Rhodoplanes sp. Z2-YC6860]